MAFAEDKKDLEVLNDRPLNAQAEPHKLDQQVTPTHSLFVRNNGIVPSAAYQSDLSKWSLSVTGELNQEKSYTMKDLLKKFKLYTYQLVLECGGNGRAGFYPPTPGNQWTYGAVGCPEWSGIRLKDLLNDLGLKSSAKYIAYYGMDIHPSGDMKKDVISRGFPIHKALEDTTLVAFKLNGKDLPPVHGFPARLICPGFPASASGKWLKKIWVRDRVHDGAKMTGNSYKIPKNPVAPGSKVLDKDLMIIENMPVKSLITFPRSKSKVAVKDKDKFICRGFAWSGSGEIAKVDVSFDFGQTWHTAKLSQPANPFAWQRWEITLVLPQQGYYEVWSCATDMTGKSQPMVTPGWNPKGYVNNAMPRIAINVV